MLYVVKLLKHPNKSKLVKMDTPNLQEYKLWISTTKGVVCGKTAKTSQQVQVGKNGYS